MNGGPSSDERDLVMGRSTLEWRQPVLPQDLLPASRRGQPHLQSPSWPPPSPGLVTPATACVGDPVGTFSRARRSGVCSSGPELPQARPPATQPSHFRHPSPETGSWARCQLSALWPDCHPARTWHGGGPGGDLGLRAEQRGGEDPEGPVIGSLQSSGQCVGQGGWPLDPRSLASDRRGCSHPGRLPSCA